MIRGGKWCSVADSTVKDSPSLCESIGFLGKEFDTYKVGTVANSTSTMHTIHTSPIELKSFEVDDYKPMINMKENVILNTKVSDFIETLEELRQLYLKYSEMAKNSEDPEEKKKLNVLAKWYWKELIRWTPNGWIQTRTVTMNYETLLAMCSPGQRRFHKLNEWSGIDNDCVPNFIKAVRQLPYAQDFIFGDETK